VSLAKHVFADLPSQMASVNTLSLRVTSNSYNQPMSLTIIIRKENSKQDCFSISDNRNN
jgi:hypothetical protein